MRLVARHLTGVFVTACLIAALLGGECFACVTPAQKSTGCCSESGQCQRPEKVPTHSHCAVAPVDLTAVEQAAVYVTPAVPVLDTFASALVDTRTNVTPVLRDVDASSPPDLCLLNSSFLI